MPPASTAAPGRPLGRRALEVYAAQLKADEVALRELQESAASAAATAAAAPDADGDAASRVSLAGKWAPRAGHHWAPHAKQLARMLFPGAKAAEREYRRLVVALGGVAHAPEVAMCAGKFGEIAFVRVPAKAMLKYRKAFLNEALDRVPSAAQDLTGNRRSANADRVTCRKRLRKAVLQGEGKKLKGGALMPHEIVAKLLPSAACSCGRGRGHCALSTLEADLLDVQWQSLVDDVKAQLTAAAEANAAAALVARDPTLAADLANDGEDTPAAKATKLSGGGGVDLGKMVALVDVSGSMSGTPMEAAIALGLIVAELTAPAFRNRILTFESAPKWVSVPERGGAGGASLHDCVSEVARAPWGGSTNIEAALDRVLGACVAAKCAPEDIPELLVLSDMQFDCAHRGGARAWETAHEWLVRRFADAGRAAVGAPWDAPTVTYWNLRGDTGGHAASASTPGVRLLSGFSPALLKLVLSGDASALGAVAESDDESSDDEAADKAPTKKRTKSSGKAAPPTPWETLRKALDDPRYDLVREALRAKDPAAEAAAVAGGDNAAAVVTGLAIGDEDTRSSSAAVDAGDAAATTGASAAAEEDEDEEEEGVLVEIPSGMVLGD